MEFLLLHGGGLFASLLAQVEESGSVIQSQVQTTGVGDVGFSAGSLLIFSGLLSSVVGALVFMFKKLLDAKDRQYEDMMTQMEKQYVEMKTQLQAENTLIREERGELLELTLHATVQSQQVFVQSKQVLEARLPAKKGV